MLLCLIKNIFGQDHTAIDKQAKELKNCIAEFTTAQDLAKYRREVLSNRQSCFNTLLNLGTTGE